MGHHILLVDDSPTVRTVIRKTLKSAGIDVAAYHEASDGAEALELFRENRIDLAIIDLNMPVMNGLELVDAWAAEGVLAKLPVVVLSTDGSETQIRQLQAKGIKAYIRKPFTPELLRDVFIDLLGEPT